MQSTSPLDGYRKQVEEWLERGESYNDIVWALRSTGMHTSERSLRRAVIRWGLTEKPDKAEKGKPNFEKEFEKPGFNLNGDEADITSDPRKWKRYLNNTDQLLRERGLDPDDWEIANCVVNEWDWHGETYKQLKVHLKRKRRLEMVVPARVKLGRVWSDFGTREHLDDDEAELVVFVGDQHAPFQDPDLHKRFCEFLYDCVPSRGVLMGDTIDLANISRHPHDPDWQATTQECLDSAGQMLVEYREASERTAWVKLPGNHEERLRRAIIDRLGDFVGLSPAKVANLPDLPPILNPAYLLRLDELNIKPVGYRGSYKHSKHVITPYLVATHGESSRAGSGASVLAALGKIDHSLVIGHTHRQALVQRTVAQSNGAPRLLQGGETGCMCMIKDGLGYAPGPDWSNGFITAAVWPNGTFKLDLATYVDGKLHWRSERY